MVFTALHEREVPSNAPNERISRNAPDLHAETRLEVGDQEEREDHGTVTERPLNTPPKCTSSDNHVGEDASDTVKSGRSRGESPAMIPLKLELISARCGKRLER